MLAAETFVESLRSEDVQDVTTTTSCSCSWEPPRSFALSGRWKTFCKDIIKSICLINVNISVRAVFIPAAFSLGVNGQTFTWGVRISSIVTVQAG